MGLLLQDDWYSQEADDFQAAVEEQLRQQEEERRQEQAALEAQQREQEQALQAQQEREAQIQAESQDFWQPPQPSLETMAMESLTQRVNGRDYPILAQAGGMWAPNPEDYGWTPEQTPPEPQPEPQLETPQRPESLDSWEPWPPNPEPPLEQPEPPQLPDITKSPAPNAPARVTELPSTVNQGLQPTPPETSPYEGGELAPNQFDRSLTQAEALAACGPAAYVAFARATGRNPTIREAVNLARQYGWSEATGMRGPASEAQMLRDQGIPTRLDSQVDEAAIQHDALTGNPVMISTPGHYFVVDGYDANTGKYHVGNTGTAYRNGSPWMTLREMTNLTGAVNGVLFLDSPASPIPSVAATGDADRGFASQSNPTPAGTGFDYGPIDNSSREAFLRTARPYAEAVQAETGIPAAIMLGIAANETGNGRYSQGNNYFGIKGQNPDTGASFNAATWEVENGQRVNTRDTFRAYDNPAESFRDFARFLADNPRYGQALQQTSDPEAFIRAVHRAGYATDPNWSNQVIAIARQSGIPMVGATFQRPSNQPLTTVPSSTPVPAELPLTPEGVDWSRQYPLTGPEAADRLHASTAAMIASSPIASQNPGLLDYAMRGAEAAAGAVGAGAEALGNINVNPGAAVGLGPQVTLRDIYNKAGDIQHGVAGAAATPAQYMLTYPEEIANELGNYEGRIRQAIEQYGEDDPRTQAIVDEHNALVERLQHEDWRQVAQRSPAYENVIGGTQALMSGAAMVAAPELAANRVTAARAVLDPQGELLNSAVQALTRAPGAIARGVGDLTREPVPSGSQAFIPPNRLPREVPRAAEQPASPPGYLQSPLSPERLGAPVEDRISIPQMNAIAAKDGQAAAARAYFQPGQIVPAYGGYDEVLNFRETPEGNWAVQVRNVFDTQGRPNPYPDVRWHSTFPTPNQLIDFGPGLSPAMRYWRLEDWVPPNDARQIVEAAGHDIGEANPLRRHPGNPEMLGRMQEAIDAGRPVLARELAWATPSEFVSPEAIPNVPVPRWAVSPEQGARAEQIFGPWRGQQAVSRGDIGGENPLTQLQNRIDSLRADLQQAPTPEARQQIMQQLRQAADDYDATEALQREGANLHWNNLQGNLGEGVGRALQGRIPSPTIESALQGGAAGGYEASQQENATPEDIARGAALGAAAGVGRRALGARLTPGQELRLGQTAQDLFGRMRRGAPPGASQEMQDAYRMEEPQPAGQTLARWVDAVDPRDSYPIIRQIERAAVSVDPNAPRAHQQAVLLAGTTGKAGSIIEDELRPILRDVADNGATLNDLNQRLRYLQIPELEANGFKTPGGMTTAQAQRLLAEQDQRLGPQASAALDRATNALYDYQTRNFLDRAAGGLISNQQAADMLAKNQHYFPHEVLDFVSQPGGRQFGPGSNAVNMATDAFRKREGSERMVASPLQAIFDKTFRITSAIDRNAAADALIEDAQRAIPNLVHVYNGGDVPASLGIVSRWNNGVLEQFTMPAELAREAKQLDAQQTNWLMKAIGAINNVSRVSFTGINPDFILRNPARDMPEAFYRTGQVPLGYHNLRGIYSAIVHDDNFHQYMQANAGIGGLMESGRWNAPKTIEQLARGPVREAAELLKPWKFIARVNEVLEQGTRIGVFSERSGLVRGPHLPGPLEGALTGPRVNIPTAAETARRSTVDFGNGNQYIKAANQVVLFLNANYQGAYNAFEPLLARTPAERARAATRLGILTAAAAAVYAYNKSTPELSAQYEDIPQYVRDNFVVLLNPNGPGTDEQGRETPSYLMIPKPTIAKVLWNGVEDMMRYVQNVNPPRYEEIANSLIGAVTPFNSAADVPGLGLQTPVGEAIRGVQANYDFFRQQPIESESLQNLPASQRSYPWTTEMSKALAQTGVADRAGLSPAEIDYVVNTVFGGTGRAVSQIAGAIGQATGRFPPSTQQPASPDVAAGRLPVIRGLWRAGGGAGQQRRYEEFQARMQDIDRNLAPTLERLPDYQRAGTAERQYMERSLRDGMETQLRAQLGIMPARKPGEPQIHWERNGVPSRTLEEDQQIDAAWAARTAAKNRSGPPLTPAQERLIQGTTMTDDYLRWKAEQDRLQKQFRRERPGLLEQLNP